MKLVKNLVFTMVLASVLAVSASAGEQPIMGSPAPAPSPSPGESITMSGNGIAVNDPSPESTEASDYLFFEALAALLSMY